MTNPEQPPNSGNARAGLRGPAWLQSHRTAIKASAAVMILAAGGVLMWQPTQTHHRTANTGIAATSTATSSITPAATPTVRPTPAKRKPATVAKPAAAQPRASAAAPGAGATSGTGAGGAGYGTGQTASTSGGNGGGGGGGWTPAAPARTAAPAPAPTHTTYNPPQPPPAPPFTPHFVYMAEPSAFSGIPQGGAAQGGASQCAEFGSGCGDPGVQSGGGCSPSNVPSYGGGTGGAKYSGWAMWERAPGDCSWAMTVSQW